MDKKNNKIDEIIKICKKCNKNSNEVAFAKERLVCHRCRNSSRKNKPSPEYFENYYKENRDYILKSKAEKYQILKQQKKNNIELIL